MDGGGWQGFEDRAVGECNFCGRTRVVVWLPDPYIAELYPEDNPQLEPWCEDCYDRRADDV